MRPGLPAIALTLLLAAGAAGCDRAPAQAQRDGERLLRERIEASDDPEVRKALAPLLGEEPVRSRTAAPTR